MATMPNTISLDWRDENFGSVNAVAAFRIYSGQSAWSSRTRATFRACLRRAGFAFHEGRCSYIARAGEQAAQQRALCDELVAAGFQIIRGDVRLIR